MTRDERISVIMAVWEARIKGNPNTEPSWARHPKSFVRWSLRKYRPGDELRTRNPDYPDLMLPYNLEWKQPEPEEVEIDLVSRCAECRHELKLTSSIHVLDKDTVHKVKCPKCFSLTFYTDEDAAAEHMRTGRPVAEKAVDLDAFPADDAQSLVPTAESGKDVIKAYAEARGIKIPRTMTAENMAKRLREEMGVADMPNPPEPPRRFIVNECSDETVKRFEQLTGRRDYE